MQELLMMTLENNIDIDMAVEAEHLDTQYFISSLRKAGKNFEKKEIMPRQQGIVLLAMENIVVSICREEKYFTAYKVHENGKNRLLVVLHLTSAVRCSEIARNQRANDLSRVIQKLEESCNAEAKKEGRQEYATVVVGDFNLHPFSPGMIGMHGFHAVMDLDRAQKKSRRFNGETIKFYYNPMWNLMGKRGNALGTYFFDSDQDDNSFYWYTFDQVLLRPELMDEFVWDEFEIIDQVGGNSLIRNNKIYSKKYSDHLPIKFAVG